MSICKSVSRSLRVSGSCELWFPLVRECLCERGFQNIVANDSCRRLTADYGDSHAQGRITVSLAPSEFYNETEVNVIVTANLGGASFC